MFNVNQVKTVVMYAIMRILINFKKKQFKSLELEKNVDKSFQLKVCKVLEDIKYIQISAASNLLHFKLLA